MIDGEIYMDSDRTELVFAYRGKLGDYTLHYICVNSYGNVKRLGDGMSFGRITLDGTCIPANDEQKERFKRILSDNDYHWNKANKKVIRISTGEIL